MDKNEIIEADYKELVLPDDPQAIAAEIRFITAQVNKVAIAGILEIGRRFEKAKSMVEHGQWGEFCQELTGYSQSMAENYIKVYKEYGGSEQVSLFGDLSKSQSIGNLGISKLIELTAIPADEREQFVEENNIDESTTVKELREIIEKQKQQLWDKDISSKNKEHELKNEIKYSQGKIKNAEEEIERLTAELEEMKNRPPADAPNSDVAALIAEAEENVRASTQKTIDDLRADIEKKQKEIDKKQKQLDKLKNNGLEEENKQLKESVSEAEKKNADLAAEIERLKKEAQLGSNKKLVVLDLCFKTVQDDMSRLSDALGDCRETDNYTKLSAAITETLDNLIKSMKVGD